MKRVRITDMKGAIVTWSVDSLSVGHDSLNAILNNARMETVNGKPTNSNTRFERVIIPLHGLSGVAEERW